MPIPKLNITETNNVTVDYGSLYSDLFINLEKKYDKPPICIEVVDKAKRWRFGTLGNFSVIGGKGKSKKGFLISIINASAITDKRVFNFECSFKGKRICLFDTEQGDYDLHVAASRSIRLNAFNYHPENFDVFALRQLSTEDRLAFIERYLEDTKDLGMIVIDGVRDLLIDINNVDQSTELATKIMQWTKIYNIHAILVLHENPGSDKLRGHIGTELTNKAETVINTEKSEEDNNISIVSPKFTRGTLPFDEFAFIINEEGLPESINYESPF